MVLKQTKENPTRNSNEAEIKVSELSNYGIKLNKEFIAQYWKEFIQKSKIEELKIIKTSEEQQKVLIELFKLKEDIKSNLEQIKNWENADDSLEKTKNEKNWKIEKVKEEVKKLEEKAKVEWTKIKESTWIAAFFLWFKNIFQKILWFFWLDKYFGLWDEADKLAQKLTPEEIKETKDKLNEKLKPITSKISEHFPKHPVISKNIQDAINNPEIFSPNILSKLKQKIDSWEKIDLNTIRSILKENNKLKEFETAVFTPEAREVLKQQAEAKIVSTIEKEYNLRINPEKRAELVKLINETKDDISFTDLTQSFISWKEVDWFDFLWASIWTWIWLFWFGIKLVTKWIIWAWDLTLNVADSWVKTVELWLWKLWVSSTTYQDFEKQLGNMSSAEKWLLLWVLYRKSWMFTKLLWNISAFAIRTSTELIIPTWVSWTKVLYDSILWETKNKIDNFEKLAKSLWWTENTVLKDAFNKMNDLIKNAKIIEIINDWEKRAFTAYKIKSILIEKDLIKATDNIAVWTIKELRTAISWNIVEITKEFGLRDKLSTFYPWLKNATEEFYKKLWIISKYQKLSIASWKSFIDWFGKMFQAHKSIIAEMEISRSADKLVFEALSAEQVISKMQAMKKFAYDMPEFFKHSFWWIAEIAFVWLSLSSMKEWDSFLWTIWKCALYMSWLIWSFALFLNVWSMYDKETKKIKWFNVSQAWVWGVFLAMDVVAAWKIIWVKGVWFESWGLILKNIVFRPITSSYKSIVSLIKLSKNIDGIIKGTWKLSWWKIWKKWTEILKKWVKNKFAIAFALLVIWTIAAIEYLKTDLWKEYQKLVDEKIIDEQWNIIDEVKAKNFFNSSLNNNEKEAFVELLFIKDEFQLIEPSSNLEFKINWDKLTILTDKQYIWDWVINPIMRSHLKKYWITKIEFINNFK